VEAENSKRKIELQQEIESAVAEIAELKKKQIELETEVQRLREQLDQTQNKTSSVVLRLPCSCYY
jgi:multidrug resistance efflux pump